MFPPVSLSSPVLISSTPESASLLLFASSTSRISSSSSGSSLILLFKGGDSAMESGERGGRGIREGAGGGDAGLVGDVEIGEALSVSIWVGVESEVKEEVSSEDCGSFRLENS